MRLIAASVVPSPRDSTSTRASCLVELENGRRLTPWVELPADRAAPSSEAATDAFACLLLPVAFREREALICDPPLDPQLAENLRALTRIWATWWPDFAPVRIETSIRTPGAPRPGAAAMFSGGVDSTFTALTRPHADLVTAWGFDVPLAKPEAWDGVNSRVRLMASRLGSKIITVATNARGVHDALRAGWGTLGHGAVIACVCHLLAARCGRVLVASTHDYRHLVPWGSHPLTDPLYGSTAVTVEHDGAAFTRLAKLGRIVAERPDLVPLLRVCWREREASNCSRCNKCLRTMAALDLLGHHGAPGFDWSGYNPGAVAAVRLANDSDAAFFTELVEAAESRRDLRASLHTSLRRYFITSVAKRTVKAVDAFVSGSHLRALRAKRRRRHRTERRAAVAALWTSGVRK